MNPDAKPTSDWPMPIRTRDSLKLTIKDGPIKKKSIPDKSAESISGTRLSTLGGKCLAIIHDVRKKVGQIARKIPIYSEERLKSVNLSARIGSMSAYGK